MNTSTIAARQVLRDCRLVHAMLEEETKPDRFRVLWVAAICQAVALPQDCRAILQERSHPGFEGRLKAMRNDE
jgi:hypothetical protein